jgi:hypothetical protein
VLNYYAKISLILYNYQVCNPDINNAVCIPTRSLGSAQWTNQKTLQYSFQVIETKKAISKMSETHHEKNKADMSQQRRLTIMVIVVVTVFLVCNIADFIWWISKTTTGENPADILTCTSIFTEMFNSCVNVIIYATFGKQFRKKFFELFCSPCERYDSEISSEIPLNTNVTAKTNLSTSTPASEANSVA